ncbi:winged helix-turn-helix domain-containing protein [Paralimibaculum aggregatum]|uniref:Winged helix-turn-helix domain-containing protein n=1 Tax=Paralimibaculum aggregatum TaxID=3036245 RepID=A0ABQ6LHL2_9RHOB|nr:winged helix-turn-helix domain-containing protein [Limibaculum sp. NKW23]GMG82770.1 winged helix-turn-helix domain-containing protein [Limibaculum sp. NKW23]
MKAGPDIARIAALIGDPARANMLTALMSGKALTASELAAEAGVSPPTASGHLAKLEAGGLIGQRRQGRHRYFSLTGTEVAAVLESLMGLASGAGHLRTRPGPRDEALRRARVCYNHLAGEMATAMYGALLRTGRLATTGDGPRLTESGAAFFSGFGIALEPLIRARAPLCRECLDWSERRSHLAGSLGRAVLARIEAEGWASREPGSRAVRFTPRGEAAFGAWLGLG